MPNKLPELYLYRLIPGAKQPSRWNIKSRYPVPVVPPAPPSDQNLTNPDKPTLTYSPGSTGPVIKQTPGPDPFKLTVTAALRIIFSKQTGGSPLRTYNIFMMVNGVIVSQLLNVQIPNPNPPLPFFIDVPLNTLYYDRIDERIENIISFTATVDNTNFKESAVSNILSFDLTPNLGNDDLLAIDEPTAATNPGKPTLTIIGSPILTQVEVGGLLYVTASIKVTFATNTGGSALKTLNAYMMVNNKPVATINRSITPSELQLGYADIEALQAAIDNGATVDLTASVDNNSGETSDVSNSVSFIAALREFYPSKNY